MSTQSGSAFRSRLKAGEPLLGTFVKFPTTQAIEILAVAGFDFVIIDQEHAALDRGMTDLMILAAHAAGMAPVVRVGDAGDASVLAALDSGAVGIMFPHVVSAAKARSVARSCRYAGGSRGFAGLSRASQWGRLPGPAHMKAQDAQVTCIAMIEDVEAVDRAGEIARVDGIDALFLGRGDLTASFGDDPQAAAKVAELGVKVAAAARDARVPLMILATGKADALAYRKLGAATFMVASDHNFLKSAAAAAIKDYRSLDG